MTLNKVLLDARSKAFNIQGLAENGADHLRKAVRFDAVARAVDGSLSAARPQVFDEQTSHGVVILDNQDLPVPHVQSPGRRIA